MAPSKQTMRSDRMRALLIQVGRDAFATEGYAATSTPAIAAAAGVSRGAVYHHFDDKAALFAAVVEHELAEIATAIETATLGVDDPFTALIVGGDAYFAAMADPGRRHILLIDAPAVLGDATLRSLDDRHGARTLADGIAAAIAAGEMADVPVQAMANLLSAAFDRAALAADDTGEHITALHALIEGLRR